MYYFSINLRSAVIENEINVVNASSYLSLIDEMKNLSTTDQIGAFVETYRDPNQTKSLVPGVEFSENLDQIKKFEETNCDTTCSKGFIVKEESGTIFSEQVPKSSCENFLTMQLVKELFAASKRDYTEVSL